MGNVAQINEGMQNNGEQAQTSPTPNSAVALLSEGIKSAVTGAKVLTNVVFNKQEVVVSTAGFVTFKTLTAASAAAQITHAVGPETVTVELAPEPREVYWPGVVMSPKVRASVLPLATFPIIMRSFLVQMALNIGNVVQTEKVVHNYGAQVRASQGRIVWLLTIALGFAYIFPVLFVSSLGDLESIANKHNWGDWIKDLVNDMSPTTKGLLQVRRLCPLGYRAPQLPKACCRSAAFAPLVTAPLSYHRPAAGTTPLSPIFRRITKL